MTDEELEIQLPALEDRIPYDDMYFESETQWEDALIGLLNTSKDILLDKLFPFDDTVEYIVPKRRYDWQLRCCVELYNLADKAGLTSYAENDLSWTKVSDGLSRGLMNQLISNVGVPKRKEEIEDTEEDGE